MFFVGLAATLVVPGLGNGDLALLTIVRRTFPPWFLGVIGGAGVLTAMVPAGIMLLTAATLFVKNLWRPILAPGMTDQQVARFAKMTVLVLTVIALCSSIYSSTTLVGLLLAGYAGVTQFFPGVILGVFTRRVTMPGVFAGMATGVLIVLLLMLTNHDPLMGLNAGFIALCCNFAVVASVTVLAPIERSEMDKHLAAVM
jgi:SSS family solute:Na+ symporter